MICTIQLLLDIIFPPTVHGLLLRKWDTNTFTQLYRPDKKGDVHFLSEYPIPAIQAAVAACKFEHSYHAAKLLGHLLQHHLTTLSPKKTIIIPIPLSNKREHERGYNQVTRVLAYVTNVPYPIISSPKILKRPKHTLAQTSLDKERRLSNILDAFTTTASACSTLNNFERIIICDDVVTTGATLSEAKSVLLPHLPPHIEVICIAWAH
jgi:ComF family protein